MKLLLKLSVIATIVSLQLINNISAQQHGQQQGGLTATIGVPNLPGGGGSTAAAGTNTAATATQALTTATQDVLATTTLPLQITITATQGPTTTSAAVVASPTTQNPTTTNVPTTVNTPVSSVAATTPAVDSSIASSSSTDVSQSQSSSTSQPSQSNTTSNKSDSGETNSKTGVIAGSVVGAIVGLAVIAGFLTWCNRYGGCTKRTNRRGEQQDHGMAEKGNVGTGVYPSENLTPSLPRRLVSPAIQDGYKNLPDEYESHPDYSQGYDHSYITNNAATHYPDYSTEYEYADHAYQQEYIADSVSPDHTVNYQQQFKPDQVEQKPNTA